LVKAVFAAIVFAHKLIHYRRNNGPDVEKPQPTGAQSSRPGAMVTGLQEGRVAPVEK
jgi:hypothetical protein